MKKRAVSVLLAWMLVVSMLPSALAANSRTAAEAASTLYTLGLMKGAGTTAEGTPVFELDRMPNRAEAVAMLVRLMGKEEQALSGQYNLPFTDVAEWAYPYIGYAYQAGLTKGISDTAFGSSQAITAAQYLTFLLRALGYSDAAGDFTVAQAAEKADNISLTSGEYAGATTFTRGDVAITSCQALYCSLKGTDTTLLSSLKSAGVITDTALQAAGLTDALTAGNAHAQLIPTNRTGTTDTTQVQDTNTKELTAEEIYAKCSPAVFYIEVYDAYGRATGSGSGFFIDSTGTAVTNYHVIQNASSAKITLTNDTTYDVVGMYDYDKERDLALLKVNGSGFAYLTQGDKSSIVGGATVYAIGSPLGLSNTITQGIISNVNRIIEGQTFIQTSAAISAGSSGGALLNKYGQVIGVTSGTLTSTSTTNVSQNLNIAIPYTEVAALSRATVEKFAAVRTTTKPAAPSNQYASYSVAAGVPDLGKILGIDPIYLDLEYDARTGYIGAYVYTSKQVSEQALSGYFDILEESGIPYIKTFQDDNGYDVAAFMSDDYIVFVGATIFRQQPAYVVELHRIE